MACRRMTACLVLAIVSAIGALSASCGNPGAGTTGSVVSGVNATMPAPVTATVTVNGTVQTIVTGP